MAQRGVNRVIIIGNLGQDPEAKYLPTGKAVTNISVATSEEWKDKQTGQKQSRVEWHKIVFFDRLAEIVAEYLKKGSKVYVEGRLQTRKWQGQDGQDRYSTEIVASEMQMLDSQNTNRADGASGYGSQSPSQSQNAPSNAAGMAAGASGAAQQQPAPNFDDFDDDIPF